MSAKGCWTGSCTERSKKGHRNFCRSSHRACSLSVSLHALFAFSLIAFALVSHADEDFAAAIKKNLKRTLAEPSTDAAGGAESTALVYAAASRNALAISPEEFQDMYQDNKDLWGDMPAQDAHINYVRSQTGNVDSARLLMEFSMVPSVKSEGSDLHQAATDGDVSRMKELLDVETGSAIIDPVKSDGTTPLVTAAMMGHAEVVRLLLEQGADPEKAGVNGATAMHVAASMGHLDVINALLEGGADPNCAHKFAKSTPLHFATEMGQVDAIIKLCRAGADPEKEKLHGGRPLHIAADTDQAAAAKALIEDCKASLDPLLMGDTTPLYLAAQKGHTNVVKVLLEAGANQNFEMPVGKTGTALAEGQQYKQTVGGVKLSEHSDEDDVHRWARQFHQAGSDPSQAGFEFANGATALHAAVENGHYDAVRLLLEHGVRQTNSMQGATPLYTAAEYNRPKIAELLLKHGGDPNEPIPRDGNTPLHRALISRHTEVVRVLLKGGADPLKPNRRGGGALHLACSMGIPSIVGMLMKAARDPFAPAQDGTTCLHIAAEHGRTDFVEALLEISGKEAKIDLPGPDKQTALHMAAAAGRAAVVDLLLQRGAGVETQVESTGATPIMLAARAGSLDTVELLIRAGANVNATTNAFSYKASALFLAAQRGHQAVCQRLVAAKAHVNHRLTIGQTALFAAVQGRSIGSLRLLLESGARFHLRDVHGRTALMAAVEASFFEAVQALIQHGAKAQTKRKDGATALHVAYEKKSTAMLELLLAAGANKLVPNAQGDSVQTLAERHRDFDMLKVLGKHDVLLQQAGSQPSNDEEETEDAFANVDVMKVSRVRHTDGKVYLVEKSRGLVFASESVEDPVRVGTWDGTMIILDSVPSGGGGARDEL